MREGGEPEDRGKISLAINRFIAIELRKTLWVHRISVQEFLSYVAKLLATGDQRVYNLLMELKEVRAKKEQSKMVRTDEESLYSLMNEIRKNQRKKEE